MSTKIIVLSGRICSGKSVLAAILEKKLGSKTIKTKDLIKAATKQKLSSREDYQKAGDALDRIDGGQWVVAGLNQIIESCDSTTSVIVLDSVRIPEQLQKLRKSYQVLLTHIHLEAQPEALAKRYKERPSSLKEFNEYDQVSENPTERSIDNLADVADVVIQTDRSLDEDLYARVSARIGFRPGTAAPCVDVLVGGQYGSEGKGNIAHYLAPEYDVLIRVGGPNAGHKVFPASGEPFTFRQLPSGTIAHKNSQLVIGAGAVINLGVLLHEIKVLEIEPERLLIDPQALIIEESDIQWEKLNLENAIGSTASGVGYASARKILQRVPGKEPLLAYRVPELVTIQLQWR